MHNATDSLKALKTRQNELNKLFAPVLYRLSDPKQKEEFLTLLSAPGITVNDNIEDQVSEFLKINQPSRRFSTDELKKQTDLHFGSTNREDYGVWVYYPWSTRLVHLLDEEEFVKVRTSRNQYKITPGEYEVLRSKKIGVVGLSVGQSVSVTLAMERICGEIRLADFDILELTNLNRIRTGVHNLGLRKVYSVAREIAEIDPYLKVTCYTDGLTEKNMDDFFTHNGKLDLLIEESDGFDIKILSRFKARALQVPVLMEASDRCMVDVERFDLEPSREILHGIVRELDVAKLKSLKTNEEKIPYMLDVLGIETTSPRLKASMVEMHQTLATWPQLASAVTMGGGITADVARRILLNHYKGSGRFHIDIEELIGDKSVAGSPEKNESSSLISNDELKNLTLPYIRPGGAMDQQHILRIMEAAAAAPSFGNQQPWRWVQSGNALVLFHDPEYGYLIDGKKTGMWVSLGCALQNVVTMANFLNYDVQAEYLPGGNTGPVAVLHFSHTALPESSSASLAPMIPRRHTHRGEGTDAPLQSSIVNDLRVVVESQGEAVLKLVMDKEKIRELAELNAALERIRLLHPALNHELFEKELNTGKDVQGKGISLSQMQLSNNMETMYRLAGDPRVASLLWNWNQGSVFEKESYRIVTQSSAIGMISMPDDSVQSLLKGGMAAERLWLTATKLNLCLQPICLSLLFSDNNPKIKESRVPSAVAAGSGMLNERLSMIFGGTPGMKAVFLFRVFSAAPVSPALKKNISEIFLTC